MTNMISNFLRNLFILFVISTVVFCSIALALAFIRPANPVMDYVPQNFGIYDTYYGNFKEPECRYCHGASTSERHHSTIYAISGSCLFCHYNGAFENPIGDCKVCHVDFGPIGSFGSPHHKSELAGSGQCNVCHLYVVEIGSVEKPLYAPTITTPTPYSCENCHWPSGKIRHQASTYQGGTTGKAKFLFDWKNWFGLPKPTYWPDSLAHPQPVEANGLFATGTLQGKPYKPLNGTHHAIAGLVYPRCYMCHALDYGQPCSWDANDPYLIRYCENCHSVDSLHSIREHVTTNNIYRVGGSSNQIVTVEQKCIACHGEEMQPLLFLPAEIAAINSIGPNFGSSGISVDIIPATETCFTQDPVEGLCSFGQMMPGDTVQMRQAGQGNRWFDVPVDSWSEHLIQVRVPAGTFLPGTTYLRVSKQGVVIAPLKAFTLRKDPVINSLTPDAGGWDTVIGISGDGFGLKQEKIYATGYGYSTYVELYSSGKRYRVTKYNVKGTSWDDVGISINIVNRIVNLVDVNTGNKVPVQELYLGCWDLKVITDYFKDDGDRVYNGNGHLDLQNSGNPADVPNVSGSGDELLSRSVSEPVCFTFLYPPTFISEISPNPVVSLNTVTVYGANFGPTKGTSIIRLWNKGHTRSSVVKNANIFSWSDTEVKFRAPANTNIYGKPQIKDVQIVVNAGTPEKIVGNLYRLTIVVAP